LRTEDGNIQGYGQANVIALLKALRGDLRSLDFSGLAIRGAYVQGVQMQDATLAGAVMRECVFTEDFDAITAMAISRSGRFWAALSRRGEVRVWREEGKRLHLAWQAHTDMTLALALSPDEHTLSSGSEDGSVKLWDVERGPCSGRAGTRRSPCAWLLPPMAACSPVEARMAPCGFGRLRWARLWRTSRIRAQSSRWPGARMARSSPAGVMMAPSLCGRLPLARCSGSWQDIREPS
jgi:WD40 repeat protein